MAQELDLFNLGKAISTLTDEMKKPEKAKKKNSETKSKDVKEERGEKRFQQGMLDTLMAIKGKLILNNDELKRIGMSLAKSLKNFAAGIIKKPIDAAKGIFSAIGEFLKLGVLLLGGIEFIKGWEAAALWFGENVDVWDRISAGFAAILLALGFTDDVEATAKDISEKMHWIVDKVSKAFGDIFDTVKETITAFQEGGLVAAAKTLGTGIFDSKEAMILLGVLFGGKILSGALALVSAATTIIPLITTLAFRMGVLLFNAITSISTGLLTAVTAMGPVLLVVAAIALTIGAILWVLNDLQSENSKVKAAWEWVKEKITAILDVVNNGIAYAVDKVKDGLSAAWTSIQGVADSVFDIVNNVMTGVVENLQAAWDRVTGIGDTIRNVMTGVIEKIEMAWDKVTGVGTMISEWFTETLDSVLLDIQEAWNIFKTIGTRIKTAISDAVNLGLEKAFGGIDVALEFGGMIVDKVSGAVTTVLDKAFDLGSSLVTAAKDLKDRLIDNVFGFVTKVGLTFSAIFATIGELLKPSTLWEVATTDKTVSDVFSNKLGEIESTGATAKSNSIDSIGTTSSENRDLQFGGAPPGVTGTNIVSTDNSQTSNNTIVHPAHTKPGKSEGYTKTGYQGFKITDVWQK